MAKTESKSKSKSKSVSRDGKVLQIRIRDSPIDIEEMESGERLAVMIEAHMLEALQKWAAIYQHLEGESTTMQNVAKRWLYLALEFVEDQVDRGEIDLNNWRPGQRLP